MDDPTYPRFRWLVPGRLAGAPHPELYGGLPALGPWLSQAGVGAIVTLCEEPLAHDPADWGLRSGFFPTQNYRPPPDLPAVVAFIDTAVADGLGVLVHCFAGIGRTGTALVCWRLQHDPELSADAAIGAVRDQYIPAYARSRFPEDPSQEQAMRAFASQRATSPDNG